MKKWIKVLIALVIVGAVAAGLVYQFVYNKPHPDYEMEPAVYSLQAEKLFEAFKNNTQKASEKYNGKVIEVTGEIDTLEQNNGLVTSVFAFSEGMFGTEGVRVTMLDKYNYELKNHPRAEEITLKGFCSGYNGTDVIIEKGSIANEK